MKTIKKVFLTMLVFALLFNLNAIAQEDEFKPVYLTITTMHRSFDFDGDISDWDAVEKEYFDKVTMKNDYILRSGVYFHYFSPDASEIIQVTIYQSWSDIELAAEKSGELVRDAWPDEEVRKAYFEKRNSFYAGYHSDEIMASTPFQIEINSTSKDPLIFYVKKNQRGVQGEGKGFKEYFENVTSKNKFLKGYFTHVHAYGSNSNDASEVFVFDSFGDIERAFEEDQKLIEAHWEFEDERKEFFKEYRKNFSGHGDYIYQNVPTLVK